MVLSQREKLIAIVLGGAVGLLVLDRLVYEPLAAWNDQIATDEKSAHERLSDADRLFKRDKSLKRLWTQITASGLKSDASEAEYQLQLALLKWMQESGVTMQTWQPERPSEKNGFIQIGFQTSGTGTTAAVSNLLWRLETAGIPVRINDVTITSKTEGTDDLQVQLNLSTLCQPPPDKNKPGGTKVASAGVAEGRS